eukprot:80597-Amphidinium_carterae.1
MSSFKSGLHETTENKTELDEVAFNTSASAARLGDGELIDNWDIHVFREDPSPSSQSSRSLNCVSVLLSRCSLLWKSSSAC